MRLSRKKATNSKPPEVPANIPLALGYLPQDATDFVPRTHHLAPASIPDTHIYSNMASFHVPWPILIDYMANGGRQGPNPSPAAIDILHHDFYLLL